MMNVGLIRSALTCFSMMMLLPAVALAGPKESSSEQSSNSDTVRSRHIYGVVEEVYVEELGIRLSTKVDTGAESASLSATEIERFKRDDEKWVRFNLAVKGFETKQIELPLSHNVRILRRASDYERGADKDYARRPVVELTLCVGNRKAKFNVNLADRRRFSQPMLIGRDALVGLGALVDVSAENAMGAPTCDGADRATQADPELIKNNKSRQEDS